MAVKVLGNHSVGYLGHRNIGGHGVNNNKQQGIGWDCFVASEAGDVYVVNISDLIMEGINYGVFFQSEAGCTVDFTLCNSSLAENLDPEVQTSVLWSNTLTVPANTITPGDVLFTCLKITFTAPGAVYVGMR